MPSKDSADNVSSQIQDKTSLENAEYDLKFLLNQGYRKKGAVNFVSNKYRLVKDVRNYLVRKVFSDEKCAARKKKIVDIQCINDMPVFVDGYNVLITVEIICNNEHDKLIMCNDGVFRDHKAVFGKYKSSYLSTENALNEILILLAGYDPACLTFFYDSPVSKSGDLAKLTEKQIQSHGLIGRAVTSKIVDFELVKLSDNFDGIVATSDSVVMDRVKSVLDIPYWICDKKKKLINFDNDK